MEPTKPYIQIACKKPKVANDIIKAIEDFGVYDGYLHRTSAPVGLSDYMANKGDAFGDHDSVRPEDVLDVIQKANSRRS